MKKELLLTAMITAGITTTAFAASNLDISATTAAPLSMQNSIAYKKYIARWRQEYSSTFR